MKYCVIVEYDGSAFAGWQKNKNTGSKRALQDIFELILSEYYKEAVQVQASGRTDAGVNAKGQVFHFVTSQKKDAGVLLTELRQALERGLRPEERGAVAIRTLCLVPDSFHSRFAATGKTYEYYLEERVRPGVFDRRYAYPAGGRLDLEAMQRMADYLIGEHDFRAFSSQKDEKKDTVRCLREIRIERVPRKYAEGTLVRLSFTGNGFLYHMVRILAGTLLEAGQGLRAPESVLAALEGGERCKAGPMLHAEALFLKEVYYPEQFGIFS